MARKRKFNPTKLETGLLTVGGVLVGGIGGFLLASWGCGRVIEQGIRTGQLQVPTGTPPRTRMT